ncbi:hypothetical protein EDD99_6019 [Streptomyces sp. 846.5]|nr:hypothetical protein [Streptomyces sp. 846.5]TDT97826.1 hypothetical protein EDD99_6019 [Streptomyces sp. 846.5]
MTPALRVGRTTGPVLHLQAAGNALLVHPRGEADPQAVQFAAGLARDDQHLLVVVDLPFGALDTAWPAVARLLAPHPGSLRLIFGRATPQEARHAGQAIADRLGRLVLAPDGELLPTAGGGLFIPADHGAGWLRLRPGREPERDSPRFPKPLWEFSTVDRPWETSPYGVVESVPSGVWVRSARPRDLLAGWRRLIGRLPSDPTMLTIVLGCPEGPAVPLADVLGVWESILPSVRSRVKFVHFGPVAVPGGIAVGQALADAFGQPVTLWTDIPLGAGPLEAEVPGWDPFVQALGYTPGSTAPPVLYGLRPPLAGARQIGAGLYEYTSAAVLEVVQCGLWMRPAIEPPNSDEIRRIPAAPGYAALLYDRSSPESAERMRALAEDMLWRLEPAARPLFRVAPADDPAVAAPPGAEDAWSLPEPSTEPLLTSPAAARRRPAHVALWADSEGPAAAVRSGHQHERALTEQPALGSLAPDESPATAPAPAGGHTAAPPPAVLPLPLPLPDIASHAPATAAGPPLARTQADSPESGTAPDHLAPAPVPVPATLAAGHPAGEETSAAGAGAPPLAPAAGNPVPGSEPPGAPRSATPPLPEAPSAPEPPALPDPAPTARPAPPTIAGIRLESGAPIGPLSAALEQTGPPQQPDAPSPAPGGVRVQPVPNASASTVPPERGLDQERDWVRRTFSRQYHAIAGSVSRVMSESPGLRDGSRTGADALTDLVAVRLYLSGDSAEVDAAVRGGAIGPHVPLARCIASGLRRLPSYRGAALLRARLNPAERDWYQEGRLVTEWAFCTASTDPQPVPDGTTDVLLWSMTARRTSLLDPGAPGRVIFLPGTTFKVLRAEADSKRPLVLLREVAPAEAAGAGEDTGRAPLDDLALEVLERAAEALRADAESGTHPGAAHAVPAAPPGLLGHAPLGAARKGATL